MRTVDLPNNTTKDRLNMKRTHTGWLRRYVAIPIALALAALAATAASAAAAPQFTVTTAKSPTTEFRIGDRDVRYQVIARNTGDPVPAGTPATMRIVFPAGITVRSIDDSGTYYGLTSVKPICAVTGQVVSCTGTTAIPSAQDFRVQASLRIDDAAVDGGRAEVEVSGGGAPTASLSDPLTILPRRPFGLTYFEAGTLTDSGAYETVSAAGSHPYAAQADFAINTIYAPGPVRRPVEPVKDLITDLPAGFLGNPRATPRCNTSLLTGNKCPIDSQIGTITVDLGSAALEAFPVYNMVPERGNAAQFGAAVGNLGIVHIAASLRSDSDFGVRLTTRNIPSDPAVMSVKVVLWGTPADPRHDAERSDCSSGYCLPGASSSLPPVPFISNLHRCEAETPVTTILTNSWVNPGDFKRFDAVASPVVDCDKLTFEPAVDIAPTETAADTPTGLNVDMRFPTEDNADGLAPPPLKKAVVTLPEGMTVNPAGAGGLEACADDQLNLKVKDEVSCPLASKIGEVTATSPVLEETLSGGVYIRSQNSMDPESGEMFRLALVLENAERGLSIRLPGQVRVNKDTGRIETTFDNNPQLPVEDIHLKFKDGPRAPLATPPTCGVKTVDTVLTSWGGQTQSLQSSFTVPCTDGLGAFSPLFAAATQSPVAGGFSPFNVKIDRQDGQDVLAGVKVDLPAGLLAKVKGNLGTQIGEVDVAAGPGSQPFWLKGKVFFEGAYGDAPYSLRVVVPAKAGPFDLGDVTVKQKVYVDPATAQVSVVSDPVPIVVKGVPVRLRTLNVSVNKDGFIVNPTSCDEKQVRSTLTGAGGHDASVASRFQVGKCADLPFKPKLALSLVGKNQVTTGTHPRVKAQVNQTGIGEAGIQKAVVRLPKSLALDPENAQALCEFEDGTKPDLENHCPAGSIVGRARAKTPLLERDLVGNVYFVKNVRKDAKTGNAIRTLPMIVVALRGEIAVNLKGESSTTQAGRLVNTFANVPDAPISQFNLNIAGGENGILAVTRTRKSKINVCASRQIAEADMGGQNGRRHDTDVRIKTPCAKSTKKSKKAKKGQAGKK